MTDEKILKIAREYDHNISGDFVCDAVEIVQFARRIAALQKEEDTKVLTATPVLIDGNHPYTALQVQAMLIELMQYEQEG